MRKLTHVTGKAYPINVVSINTDQIIAAKWLKKIERTGYEDGLFELWRKDPDFCLNDPGRAGGKIIIGGPDFGSGSSREIAVWAMRDFGIEAVIAPSIADIHRNNLPSGPVVPCVVPLDAWQKLLHISLADPQAVFTIDVAAQTITAGEWVVPFSIDEAAQQALLSGRDAIDETLKFENLIAEFEGKRATWLPVIPSE